MLNRKRIPWRGMALAFLTMGVLLFCGVRLLVLGAVEAVWLLSLLIEWLQPPADQALTTPVERIDPLAVARTAMSKVLEPLASPVLLLDGTRIICANAAARSALGAHIGQQDARIALRHPEAIALLDRGDAQDTASITLSGLTGAGSLWQLTRHGIDQRHTLIELRDRTTEADIGRAHTDFVANASHELRTPLAAIIGYVETLAEVPDKLDTETSSRFLAVVLREARRMNALVADLMSLSQLEAEKHDAPTERIELGALAARVVGEFPQSGGTNAPRLRLERPEAPLPVAGDVKQLEQLVRNLIDNALKYGDADKPVTVSLSGEPRHVLLAVADRGAGIAPDHIPHLTRRFYRTDPGRSRAAGGTGLGLAIVKHIVERHLGRLDITSTLGEGTTVSVRLPQAA